MAPPVHVLYVTVEGARRILAPRGSKVYTTLKAKPRDVRASLVTAHATCGDDGHVVFQESFTVLLAGVTQLELKVVQGTQLQRVHLGLLRLDVPAERLATAAEPLVAWYPLHAVGKHINSLKARTGKAGRHAGDLGELHVRMWRAAASRGDAAVALAATPPKPGLLSRLGRNVRSVAIGRLPGHGHHSHLGHICGTVPALDSHVHVDIVRARGLLPADFPIGSPPSEWTSDPYCLVSLLPSFQGMDAAAKTGTRVATLTPAWDETFVIKSGPGVQGVLVQVYDADVTSRDDFLGEVMVPLPPLPPPGEPHDLTQGWFQLGSPPERAGELLETLQRMGKPPSVEGALGEIYVRLSRGTERPSPNVNLRPALRPRLGQLVLTVHNARGLPPKYSNRALVHCRLESQVAVTSEERGTSDPDWNEEEATFTFAVTELTSDLVMTLIVREPVHGNQVCGEVVVPLLSLITQDWRSAASAMAGPALHALVAALAQRAGQRMATYLNSVASALAPPGPRRRWARLLPGRHPGEALVRLAPKPAVDLGILSYSIDLELFEPAPYAYLAPDVLPHESLPGHDASNAFSYAALTVALGRVLDCIFAPIFAPLRTLLYLQSWQSPRLNRALMGALTIGTLRYWFAFRALLPLWLLLWPFFHGYVSLLIAQGDRVLLYDEEKAEEEKRKAVEYEEYCNRWYAQRDLEAKLMAEHTRADPSLAASLLSHLPGSSVVSAVGSLVSGTLGAAADAGSALNIYKKVMGKLENIHGKCLGLANWFEPMIAVFTFRDAPLSATFAAILAAFGLTASLGVGIIAKICGFIGIGWNHVTLALGLLCFRRSGAPWTRSVLDTIDGYIELMAAVAVTRPLTWGPGLVITAPKRDTLTDMTLTGDALQAALQRETEAAVEAKLAAKEALRVAHSTLRPVSLTARDILGMEWLPRLLDRAPTVPRETHCAMLARASSTVELEPPHRPVRSSLRRSMSRSVSGFSRHAAESPMSPASPATPRSSKDEESKLGTPGSLVAGSSARRREAASVPETPT